MDLFTPIKIGSINLPNRIAMAPMTRNRATRDNIPQDWHIEYYSQRATAGLLITEATQVTPQGIGYPFTPGIHNEAQVKAWKKVTDAVHEKGGHIFLQLWHVGRISHPSLQVDGALPVAPSAIKPAGECATYEGMKPFETPRALELDEIPAVVEQFKSGAQYAKKAGFDGVEIHAANGYLIDQFIRDGSNHRTDQYGGSLENRARLLLEVTEAVCSAWDDHQVAVRLSPRNPYNDMRDSNPEATFSYMTEQLNQFKLAYLHIVEPGYGDNTAGPDFNIHKLRKIYQGNYMVNGGYDLQRGTAAISSGDADLVSYGVLLLANPDLPERFAREAPLNEPDPATFYGGDEKGYTDYPYLES
ncbi:alkene reductase [Kaarinaea lacus]